MYNLCVCLAPMIKSLGTDKDDGRDCNVDDNVRVLRAKLNGPDLFPLDHRLTTSLSN